MKLLITGGAGFIGSNIVKYFHNKGHKCVVVDCCTYASDASRITKLNIPMYKLDIATCAWLFLLEKEQPHYIINTAADTHVDNSILDYQDFIHSNYIGVCNLVKGLRTYGKAYGDYPHLIHFSTDEVYGDVAINSNKKFIEQDKLNPSNPYSATKAAADLMLMALNRTYNDFIFTILRPSNNYGPNQHNEKFLPTIIRSILNNEKIPIYGKGDNIREWLFVEDTVKSLDKIMQKPKEEVNGQIFNIGSSESYANIEVVKKVLTKMNKSDDLISFVPDRPGHDRKYALNSSKAQKILNWKTETKFNDGILQVIDDITHRITS